MVRETRARLCQIGELLRVAAAGVLVAFVSLLPVPALAIPAQPAGWMLANVDLPLVANGVILFRFFAPYGETPTSLQADLLDSAGLPVQATVEDVVVSGSRAYAILRPAQALVEGDRAVEWDYLRVPLASGPAATLDPLALSFAVELDTVHRPVDSSCCLGTTTISPFGPASPPCVPDHYIDLPAVTFDGWFADNSGASRQFLYRFTLNNVGQETESDWLAAQELGGQGAANAWAVALQVHDEYCYDVDAHNLVTGAETRVASGCITHSLGPLPERAPTQEELAALLNINNCLGPPSNLVSDWCQVNAATCADPTHALCLQEDYAGRCAGQPATAGAGAAGIGAGVGGGTGAGTGTGGVGAGVGGSGTGGSGAGGSGAGGSGAGGSGGTAGSGAAGMAEAAGQSSVEPVAGSAEATGVAGASGEAAHSSRTGCGCQLPAEGASGGDILLLMALGLWLRSRRMSHRTAR